MEKKARMILTACLLFVMPAFLYSVAISCVTGKVVILSESVVQNPRHAAGLDMTFLSSELKGDSSHAQAPAEKPVPSAKERSLADVADNAWRQFKNLWTPNSFPVTRVAGVHSPETWSYGISNPRPWMHLLAGAYVLIMVLGIAGLCLSDMTPFKVFSIVALATFSFLAFLAYVCSRFRVPFMFVFVIYAAHLLANPRGFLANLRNPARTCSMLVLYRVFWGVMCAKMASLGSWG